MDSPQLTPYNFSILTLLDLSDIISSMRDNEAKAAFAKELQKLLDNDEYTPELFHYDEIDTELKKEDYQWVRGDIVDVLTFFDANFRDSDHFAWWDTSGFDCDLVISRTNEFSYLYLIPEDGVYDLATYCYKCELEHEEFMIFAIYSYFNSVISNKRRTYRDFFFIPFGLKKRFRA